MPDWLIATLIAFLYARGLDPQRDSDFEFYSGVVIAAGLLVYAVVELLA